MSITLRNIIDDVTLCDEDIALKHLTALADLEAGERGDISARAADLVTQIRASDDPGLMEVFLAEYGLSTDEGIALMCLAEALLRVPDAPTIDALIEDKIAPSNWASHLGQSTSPLVNASTWALMLTGRVLDDEKAGLTGALRGVIKRLGEPVIRTATMKAMREMGRQFVLGENITSAMKRAGKQEEKGYTYSYDMLGEAARTDAQARAFHLSYSRAIAAIAGACIHDSVAQNPGISVKLSALHPRYEVAQKDSVMRDLVPRLRSLALLAKSAGMGLNIDAEEADRLSLSLDIIDQVLAEPALAGWDGFGVVVQAYGPRAPYVIDWLNDLAVKHERKIMVRLVKGAYWDAEIKRAQVEGLSGFPVFTRKELTDISYIGCARKLLKMSANIYPQFATHNAHTTAAILHMATLEGVDPEAFEFQRLHGMGEALHGLIKDQNDTHCRIYAPVGAHSDLLAYLVRRLLENGANSSFVNKIVDEDVPASEVAACPFDTLGARPALPCGPDLFSPERGNSKGFDLTDTPTLERIEHARAPFRDHVWHAVPLLAVPVKAGQTQGVENPALPDECLGDVQNATRQDVEAALAHAAPWGDVPSERANVLRRAASLFEDSFGEIFALLTREAGKSLPDCVGELREAVDFLHYYAAQAELSEASPLGKIACISPWNFPLAIFAGQIGAALAAGNAVLAKPAEQTPLIAFRAVEMLHKAGVPRTALQLLPGGGEIGAALSGADDINGMVFTGSTQTARKIRINMAAHMAPGTPLIAETGGLNAMIVDSTALPEHAVRDIVASAFQSAGQRCSALRCLYVQADIAEDMITLLTGAMKELTGGNPWDISTDTGPVIDNDALKNIEAHIEIARADNRIIHQNPPYESGHFIPPTLIKIDGIQELKREIFGPVLHIVTFNSNELEHVINDINATGYGLTFGLHTRIDDRVQEIVDAVNAGNIYVNRNQIGAVVGSQPFGGEGLSGTGPKAGGPHYLPRFQRSLAPAPSQSWAQVADMDVLAQKLLNARPLLSLPHTKTLPGPTGELNQLSYGSRGPILCLGPSRETAETQAQLVVELGGAAVIADGNIVPETLQNLAPLGAVMWWGDAETGRAYERALAERDGPIIALITGHPDTAHVLHERHLCVDTTASGGNATLLAEISQG